MEEIIHSILKIINQVLVKRYFEAEWVIWRGSQVWDEKMGKFFDEIHEKLNTEKDQLDEFKESLEIIQTKFTDYEAKIKMLKKQVQSGNAEKKWE